MVVHRAISAASPHRASIYPLPRASFSPGWGLAHGAAGVGEGDRQGATGVGGQRSGNWKHGDPGKQLRLAKPGGARLRGQGCFSLHKRIKNQSGSESDLSLLGSLALEGGVDIFVVSTSGGEEGACPASRVIQGGRRGLFWSQKRTKARLLCSRGFAIQTQLRHYNLRYLSFLRSPVLGGRCLLVPVTGTDIPNMAFTFSSLSSSFYLIYFYLYLFPLHLLAWYTAGTQEIFDE